MRPIWDNLRRKVDGARNSLPSGISGPIVNDEFGDVFGTLVSITGEGYNYADLKEVADDCRNELLLIKEVAKVEIFGEQWFESGVKASFVYGRTFYVFFNQNYLKNVFLYRAVL